jgi:hypothetical protein
LFLTPDEFANQIHNTEESTSNSSERMNSGAFPASLSTHNPSQNGNGRVKDMAEAIRTSFGNGHQVVLLASTLGMAERLRDLLHEYDVPFRLEFGEQPLKALKVSEEVAAPVIGIGRISTGMRLPDISLEIYAEAISSTKPNVR